MREEQLGATGCSTKRMPNRDLGETAQTLRDQAAGCRRLAKAVTDGTVSSKLFALAVEFGARAQEIEPADQRRLPDS